MSCRSYLEEVHALTGSDVVGKTIMLMTSVKGRHTGRVWFIILSASLRIVVMRSSLLSCILKTPYLDLEKILSSG